MICGAWFRFGVLGVSFGYVLVLVVFGVAGECVLLVVYLLIYLVLIVL